MSDEILSIALLSVPVAYSTPVQFQSKQFFSNLCSAFHVYQIDLCYAFMLIIYHIVKIGIYEETHFLKAISHLPLKPVLVVSQVLMDT